MEIKARSTNGSFDVAVKRHRPRHLPGRPARISKNSSKPTIPPPRRRKAPAWASRSRGASRAARRLAHRRIRGRKARSFVPSRPGEAPSRGDQSAGAQDDHKRPGRTQPDNGEHPRRRDGATAVADIAGLRRDLAQKRRSSRPRRRTCCTSFRALSRRSEATIEAMLANTVHICGAKFGRAAIARRFSLVAALPNPHANLPRPGGRLLCNSAPELRVPRSTTR